MNRISAIAILAIASIATCAGAVAQQNGLKANIPFAFSVGDIWLPAGEYTIFSPNRQLLEIKNGSHVATVVTSKSYEDPTSTNELVFNKYGDQYFLRKVVSPKVSSLNLSITSSKTEKWARKHAIEARIPGSGEPTMVAAR